MLAIRTMPTRVGTLTFSRRPNDAIFAAVALEPVDVWWNLAAELRDLEPRMERCAAAVLSARITDYEVPVDVPAFAAQLDEVVALLFCQGRVHVSCYGGRGRTGLALACIAMLVDEIAPEAALTAAHAASGGPETEEQRAFVQKLHADLRG